MALLTTQNRAVVYIWPFLKKEAQQEREEECVYAGYKNKRLITVREVLKIYQVT